MKFMNNYKREPMKKGVIALLILLMFPLIRISAQNQNLERLNAYKIGFFTKRLNLTSQEAEKFWPVYNEYQKQKNSIQQEKISLIRNFNQNESTLSDLQLTETGDKLVACIVQAENQYKAQLLTELQNRQQQRPIPRRDL